VSIKHSKSAALAAVLIVLAAVLLALAAALPVQSRIWKGSPTELARDYVTISDTRGNGEFILLMWFVPQMVSPDTPGMSVLKPLLDKYVLLMAAHAKLDKTTARLSFEDIDAIDAKDQAGKPLAPVARKDLPPTLTGMLAVVETMFRQSAGAMGQGMKMSVFDAGAVNSCKRGGGLAVVLGGETYTWQTPIPGCPSA
jgi:hypothetical protein